MGKPMLRVGLLVWATSCGGLGCAVAADKKREVPDVDHYVEKSIILLLRIRVYYKKSKYIITMKTWDESRSTRSRPQNQGDKNWTKTRLIQRAYPIGINPELNIP